MKNPKYKWNLKYLGMNSNITLKIVKDNPILNKNGKRI